MEEARFWMWTKRNDTGLSSLASTTKSTKYGDSSWEEQAFAEDAAGHLGGCIWPPRSYTCSFCRREFRSAQALGGHMNVHRRDRARLKQSPTPNNNHILNPSTSLGIHQHPSMVYNKEYSDDQEVLRPPNFRVSPPTVQVRFDEKSLLASSFSSPVFQEQQNKTSILSPLLWSDFVADKYNKFPDLQEDQKNFNLIESKCRAKRDYAEADLCASLNSVVGGNDKETASSGEEDNTTSFKRRRTDDETVLFFPNRNSGDKIIAGRRGSELVLEISPISKEDLDLELRLGA